MILTVGESKYNVNRAEQVIMSGTENLTVFSNDTNIDVSELDENIRAHEADGFAIDAHNFKGFKLNCIRKSFSDDEYYSVSIELYKEKAK